MQQLFPNRPGNPMRYFIGDVRDLERLKRAIANYLLLTVYFNCQAPNLNKQ